MPFENEFAPSGESDGVTAPGSGSNPWNLLELLSAGGDTIPIDFTAPATADTEARPDEFCTFTTGEGVEISHNNKDGTSQIRFDEGALNLDAENVVSSAENLTFNWDADDYILGVKHGDDWLPIELTGDYTTVDELHLGAQRSIVFDYDHIAMRQGEIETKIIEFVDPPDAEPKPMPEEKESESTEESEPSDNAEKIPDDVQTAGDEVVIHTREGAVITCQRNGEITMKYADWSLTIAADRQVKSGSNLDFEYDRYDGVLNLMHDDGMFGINFSGDAKVTAVTLGPDHILLVNREGIRIQDGVTVTDLW